MSRRGAYSAGVFTLAAFLMPALLAPGPFELANIAGVALAIWMGVEASRSYQRDDIPGNLPYRIGPVGPGIVASAAILFCLALDLAWSDPRDASDVADRILDARLTAFWDFPFSPARMYAMPMEGLPTPSAASVAVVNRLLTAALLIGLVVSLLALVGGVSRRASLRRHALLWKGIKVETAADELARRGARGLRPVRDPLPRIGYAPVSGRLFLRSFSMLIAFICLPYAPVFLRLLEGSRIPQVQTFFATPLFYNPFLAVWLPGLWAIIVAVAMVLVVTYLRLGFVLRTGSAEDVR